MVALESAPADRTPARGSCAGRNLQPEDLDQIRDRALGWIPDPTPGCWDWTGPRTTNGYGLITLRQKRFLAHRVVYQLLVGPVLDGHVIDHLCRNTLCVNPRHLEAVTQRENALRGNGVPARNARKTHCKHGHALTADNTYLRADGRRQCKRCVAIRSRAYRAQIPTSP